jgi:hypothetical protein
MTSASESIRKNRRDYVTRTRAHRGYPYQQPNPVSGVVNAPRLDLPDPMRIDPLPGGSAESVPESESADRQAEDSQGR